jgi:hypothetical protein
VEPSALQAALGLNSKFQGAVAIANGAVAFDMDTEAADIAAGVEKHVLWTSTGYIDVDPTVPDVITMGPLSAFGITVLATLSTNVAHVFDTAAQVALGYSSDAGPGDLAIAWIWPDELMSGAGQVVEVGTEPFIMYEGSPVTPNLRVRTGMIPGVTPADATVTYRFCLWAYPQAVEGGARIRIPSPYCAPPFVPTGAHMGKHIFSELAANNMPKTQKDPFPRLFRSVAIETALDPATTFDAKVLGGPWRGHLAGATAGGVESGNWAIQTLLGGVPTGSYTPIEVASVPTIAAADLHTEPEGAHAGLRFTHSDVATAGWTEIMLDYLGG